MRYFLTIGGIVTIAVLVFISCANSNGQEGDKLKKASKTRYLPKDKISEIDKLLQEIEKNPTNKNNLAERITTFRKLMSRDLLKYLIMQGVQLMDFKLLVEELRKDKDPEKKGLLIDSLIRKLDQLLHQPIVIDRSLSIDCCKEVGRIRNFLQGNGGPVRERGDPERKAIIHVDHTKQFRELGISSVRTHENYAVVDLNARRSLSACDMSIMFPDCSKDPDKVENYDFKSSDKFIKGIKDTGADVFFRMGESGNWSKSKEREYKNFWGNFDKFAKASANVVRHYNQGWANGFKYNIKYWEIWNEPGYVGVYWIGTPQQFFELYGKTAHAIKSVDNTLKVGGPGHTQFEATDRVWGYEFLKYIKENKLPLDFYSWHWYGPIPLEVVKIARNVRKMLDEMGLENVESILTEWNEIGDPDLMGKRELFNTTLNAAYTAAVLILLQDTDVTMAYRYRTDGSPAGLFEWDGTYCKPAYAYKAMKELLQHPIRLELEGLEELPEGLAAIAGISKDKKSIAVLISDYREGENSYQLTLRNFPFSKGKFTLERYILDEKRNLELVETKNMDAKTEITLDHELEGPAVDLLIFRTD